MTSTTRILLALTLAMAGCGGGGAPKTAATGGQVGDDTAGSGGDGGAGGQTSGGAGGKGGTGGTGGTSGTGGDVTGGTGGTGVEPDAAAGAGGAGGDLAPDAGSTSDDAAASLVEAGSSQTRGDDLGWYEAEAGTITGRAVKSTCMACPMSPPMKAGDTCCSGGGEVTWIVAHGNGEVQFNAVMAPSDGMYDVTWWYYCGRNDNFGDKNCGGQTDPPTTPSGCRPHQFYVNGTLMPGAYHFPCFDGMWNIVRTATVTMALKTGANTIKMHAPPPRDSVNVDAIEIFPAGKGLSPTIMSNKDLTGH